MRCTHEQWDKRFSSCTPSHTSLRPPISSTNCLDQQTLVKHRQCFVLRSAQTAVIQQPLKDMCDCHRLTLFVSFPSRVLVQLFLSTASHSILHCIKYPPIRHLRSSTASHILPQCIKYRPILHPTPSTYLPHTICCPRIAVCTSSHNALTIVHCITSDAMVLRHMLSNTTSCTIIHCSTPHMASHTIFCHLLCPPPLHHMPSSIAICPKKPKVTAMA